MWKTSRYECKYLVPPHQIDSLRHWVALFVEPDRYAAACPGHAYQLASLYLDSTELRLYQMTECGLKNRFKLRIRSYSDEDSSPVFFEIKRRIDRTIRKSRVMLGREVACSLLGGRARASDLAEGDDRHHLETFLWLMRSVAAGPVVRVRYSREAYESASNDRVRLTLDSALSFAETPDHSFSLNDGIWRTVPVRGTVLEIKFTDCFPQWVSEMIRRFELEKIPFSKYGHCVRGMRRALRQAPDVQEAWQ